MNMSDATNALLELRTKIDANRRLLERQEQALSVMEEMMGISSVKEVTKTQTFDFYRSGIDVSTLNVADLSKRKTFKQEIIDAINLYKNQEFSVPHVHETLGLMGIKVNGAQPRARIALILSELEREQFIKKTFQGKGSVPNKFQLVKQDDEL